MAAQVLTALGDVLALPYSSVNVAVTLCALVGAFGVHGRRFRDAGVLLAIAWSAGFFLVYQLLERVLADGVGYDLNLVLSLVATVSFSLAFVAGSLSERLALLTPCLFSVMGVRSMVTILFALFADELAWLGDASTLAFYVVLYAVQALLALLFLRFPVRPATELPASARWLLMAIPASMAVITQAQFMFYTSYEASLTWQSFFFQLLSIVAMVGSYYLTCLVTRAYDELIEARSVSQALELTLDHVRRSGAIVEQVRQDKHEMKNMFLYMQALLAEGRTDELADFLNRQMPRHFDELTEFHTGNDMLDYLLTQKASEAREAGARVCFDVVVPADLAAMGISDRDLCGLLGNLLDNAVDACRGEVLAGRDAEVRLQMRVTRGYLLVEVRNRCGLNVLALNPHLRTTKERAGEHGIGLKVVRSIVSDHDGSFQTEMENGSFVATALLGLAQAA